MEVAAGLVIAEEAISSILQGSAVGAYAIAKPTLPLKCALSQFAEAPEDGSSASLARKHHTINIVGGDLYIFGGMVASDKLAGNEMHIIKLSNSDGSEGRYKCVPAIARDGDSDTVPCSRAGHIACVIDDNIVVFGGYSDPSTRQPIDEKGRAWIFSPSTLQWTHRDSQLAAPPRAEHGAAAHDNELLVVHGGRGLASSKPLADTWAYNPASNTWNELTPLPDASESANLPPSLAIAHGVLYLISNSSSTPLSNTIHTLNLKSTAPTPQWATLAFPTNPLTPGPPPRLGAGLATLHTGQGRAYLLYMLGAKATGAAAGSDAPQYSGIWALQLPTGGETSGASVKDAVRDAVGAPTHEAEWAEVEVLPREQGARLGGKAHPGPRAWFGCDVVVSGPGGLGAAGNKVVLWGGEDPTGTVCGDGWIVEVKTPSVMGALGDVPGVGRLVKGEDG